MKQWQGKTLIAFGDSIGRGVLYDGASDSYRQSENGFLSLLNREAGVTVINETRYGYTVKQGRRLFEKHRERVLGADAVLLEFGGNDCDFHWKEIAAAPREEHRPNVSPEEYLAGYRDWIGELRSMGKEVLVMNLPPIEPYRYFRHVSRGVDAENIRAWLFGDPSYIYRWHESYSTALSALCCELGVKLFDVRTDFLRQPQYGELLCDDGIHPNERGHRQLFESLMRE